MQLIDVGKFSALARFDVLLAELVRKTLFSGIVVEGADIHLVAAHPVALNPLVFIGMVQSFDRCVAFVALKTTWTVFPPLAILKGLAVLRRIFKQVWWSTEITSMVRKYATL